MIIAANWKMNKCRAEAGETARALLRGLSAAPAKDRTVMIFPPFPSVAEVSAVLGSLPATVVGGQNFYPAESGASAG